MRFILNFLIFKGGTEQMERTAVTESKERMEKTARMERLDLQVKSLTNFDWRKNLNNN